jgi:hypothetical protein
MFANPTVNLNALRNFCAKIACCSSGLIFMFLYASRNIKDAIQLFDSCIRLSSPNFKQLSVGNRSELDTCSYGLHFSLWPILSPPIILTFLPGSPCIRASEELLAAQIRLFTRHIYTARRSENWFLHSVTSMCPACSNINKWLRTCVQLAPLNTHTRENICFVSPTLF